MVDNLLIGKLQTLLQILGYWLEKRLKYRERWVEYNLSKIIFLEVIKYLAEINPER
jgi:hypothetical protein